MEPVLILAVAAVLVVAGGLVALISWAARRERRAGATVAAKWKALAQEMGGGFREASGPWYRRKPFQVKLASDGVEIVADSYEDMAPLSATDMALDTFFVSTGTVVVTYTRAGVDVPSPRSLRIVREHLLSRVARKLGLRDVEVGDAEYDRTFHVQTDDAAWLRERLRPELRRLHLEHPDVSLTLKKGRLTAVRPGLADDPGVLRALLELAALGRRAFA